MKYKIYIADDEKLIRESIAQYVNWEGIHAEVVGTGNNGRDVLTYLLSNPVDILISDIKMPVLDGIHLVQKIAEAGLSVRVIFITAYSEFEYAKQALRYEFVDDYIIKPIQPSVLLQSVEKSIQKLQQENENLKSFQLSPRELMISSDEYLLLKKKSLLKSVKQGNEAASVHILSEMERYLTEQNITLNFYKRYMLELFYTIQHIFDSLQHSLGSITNDGNLSADITSCENFQDVTTHIRQMITDICGYIARYQENPLSPVICSALELVEQHYLDQNFNLLTLSEMLDISPNHLSAKFKKETGIGFTTLLQNMRLEKVKELLARPDLKMYEIAELSGIGDVRYLSHLFKEYTGYTPSEYRAKVL